MIGRSALYAAAALIAIAPVTAHAQPQGDPNHVYGADPGWDRFREIGEQAVIAQLVDPESARITWLSGYRKGGFKPTFQGRVHGYVACGMVNARNRMGGYAGATTFIVVIDFDRALLVEMDQSSRGLRSEACRTQIAQGLFPPVPTRAAVRSTASSADDTDRSGSVSEPSPLGLTVRAMPEGAYITAIQPGSVAATAGLAPGMVIVSVNAIPLAGMGDAMTKVVSAAGNGARLELVGGKSVTLGAVK